MNTPHYQKMNQNGFPGFITRVLTSVYHQSYYLVLIVTRAWILGKEIKIELKQCWIRSLSFVSEHCLVFLQTIPNQAMNHLFTLLFIFLYLLIDICYNEGRIKGKITQCQSQVTTNEKVQCVVNYLHQNALTIFFSNLFSSNQRQAKLL